MPQINYCCDKEAPNYVLTDKKTCVDTGFNPKTPLSITITQATGTKVFVCFPVTGPLEIYEDYAWNGADVITDTDGNMFASLVHDALYQLMRVYYPENKQFIGGILREDFREKSDGLFRDFCIANGVWSWIAWLYYWALRWFGKRRSMKSSKKRNKWWKKDQFKETAKCVASANGSIACPANASPGTQPKPTE